MFAHEVLRLLVSLEERIVTADEDELRFIKSALEEVEETIVSRRLRG